MDNIETLTYMMGLGFTALGSLMLYLHSSTAKELKEINTELKSVNLRIGALDSRISHLEGAILTKTGCVLNHETEKKAQ
jgi:hypothetical protein